MVGRHVRWRHYHDLHDTPEAIRFLLLGGCFVLGVVFAFWASGVGS